MMTGTGVSAGIAIGKILKVVHEKVEIQKNSVDDVVLEQQRVDSAVAASKKDIENIKQKAIKQLGEEEAQIFDAHLMLVEDPEIISGTKQMIQAQKVNAEYALEQTVQMIVSLFESMDDEYMRERAADVKDVTGRIMRKLLGKKEVNLSDLDEEVIVAAHDLTPSDTATMDKQKVVGFLTNIGGRTSHTAIMARTLEIPAIVGLGDITEQVEDGQSIAFNGETGEVVLDLDEETIAKYEKLKEEHEQYKEMLKQYIGKESKTQDGRVVEIAANIGTPSDVEGVLKNDGDAVGLYRTEFLYMNNTSLPTEDEQYEAYKTVLQDMGGKPVIVRTMDIGGDKKLDYLKIDEEMNPFLGYRAIRFCLNELEIFKTQLRALLRASIYGKLEIMFPMISSLEELLSSKELLEECKRELDEQQITYSDDIKIGMMIEVPAAAIASDILAQHVDFFSIGTNDLIQYSCAVDRMNEKIQHLYNPYNLGVLKLIHMVIENGHKHGIKVGMCGELAGDPNFIPVLLGMGLDEFSMSATSVLAARKQIMNTKYEDAKVLVEEVLSLAKSQDIKQKINEFNK